MKDQRRKRRNEQQSLYGCPKGSKIKKAPIGGFLG